MKQMLFGSHKVELDVYENCKYFAKKEEDLGKQIEVRYEDVEAFEVANGSEIDIEGMDEDEFDEYLVLYFEDGDTATFRNSHVDMFHI